jgi:hypothetical protein
VKFLVGLAWGLTTTAVFAALTFAGMVAGAYLGFELMPLLDGGRTNAGPIAMGAAAGVTAGLVVGHRGRRWVQALLLRRLRRAGVAVTATVRDCRRRYIASSRGPGTSIYTVTLAWPGELRTRDYRFWGRGDRDFEDCVRRGKELTVRFPAGRPHRFIVEIPYAPAMADLLV